MRSKTNAVLAALEASADQQQHGEAVADLVQELIEAGMDYYFSVSYTHLDVYKRQGHSLQAQHVGRHQGLLGKIRLQPLT